MHCINDMRLLTLDELMAYLGIINAESKLFSLVDIIDDLSVLSSALSTTIGYSDNDGVATALKNLRHKNDMASSTEELTSYISFTSPTAAKLNYARTLCRKSQHECIRLGTHRDIIEYLSILSYWLFLAARQQNEFDNMPEIVHNKSINRE